MVVLCVDLEYNVYTIASLGYFQSSKQLFLIYKYTFRSEQIALKFISKDTICAIGVIFFILCALIIGYILSANKLNNIYLIVYINIY